MSGEFLTGLSVLVSYLVMIRLFEYCRISDWQTSSWMARPEACNLCCVAKGPKAIDAPSASLERTDVSLRGAADSRTLS